MEYVFVHDSGDRGVTDKKMIGDRSKRGSSLGSGARKRLADITNLAQEAEPMSPVENLKSSSLATDLYIEQLRKENIMLMKALADRNKIIELSGTELQKLRINFQKLQLQNQQLAQANSQMLAELNLGKDKRKVLDHELGCKSGLLHAIQLEVSKVKMVKCDELVESSQANKGGNKQCTINGRHQSRRPSLQPSTSNPVESKRRVYKERHSLRRSKRFMSEELDPPEAFSEEPEEQSKTLPKDPELDLTPTTLNSPRDLENKRPCLRRQSARLLSNNTEPAKNLLEIDDGKPIEPEMKDEHKRSSSRRQSMRFKSEEPLAIEAVSEETEPPLATCLTNDVKLLEFKQNERPCMKRESMECEPTEDLFEITNTCFSATPLSDNPDHKSPNEERNSTDIDKVPEHARLSMGRPLRQAAVKIQSYKELPIKVKMRRTEKAKLSFCRWKGERDRGVHESNHSSLPLPQSTCGDY